MQKRVAAKLLYEFPAIVLPFAYFGEKIVPFGIVRQTCRVGQQMVDGYFFGKLFFVIRQVACYRHVQIQLPRFCQLQYQYRGELFGQRCDTEPGVLRIRYVEFAVRQPIASRKDDMASLGHGHVAAEPPELCIRLHQGIYFFCLGLGSDGNDRKARNQKEVF